MDLKPSPNLATTSTGHALSESTYLDARFLAAQPEYEAMLRCAGIQPSWHVLDAGAGNGSYLPLLCELVGANAPEVYERDYVAGSPLAGHVANVSDNARTKIIRCQIAGSAYDAD